MTSCPQHHNTGTQGHPCTWRNHTGWTFLFVDRLYFDCLPLLLFFSSHRPYLDCLPLLLHYPPAGSVFGSRHSTGAPAVQAAKVRSKVAQHDRGRSLPVPITQVKLSPLQGQQLGAACPQPAAVTACPQHPPLGAHCSRLMGDQMLLMAAAGSLLVLLESRYPLALLKLEPHGHSAMHSHTDPPFCTCPRPFCTSHCWAPADRHAMAAQQCHTCAV